VPRAPPPRPPTARPCGAKPRRSPRRPGRAISWPGCRGDLSISSADLSTSLSPPQACMGRCPDTMSGRGGGLPPSPLGFSHTTRKGGGGVGGPEPPSPHLSPSHTSLPRPHVWWPSFRHLIRSFLRVFPDPTGEIVPARRFSKGGSWEVVNWYSTEVVWRFSM